MTRGYRLWLVLPYAKYQDMLEGAAIFDTVKEEKLKLHHYSASSEFPQYLQKVSSTIR